MTIKVKLDREAVSVEREVFEALFGQSVLSDRAGVANALRDGHITYSKLVDLSRIAEIPYPLFFAPVDMVQAHLKTKREKLMAGFSSNPEFSMNSRNRVHLPDVELIVKDLLRKQRYIKTDKALPKNKIVGLLRKPGTSIAEDAIKLMNALELSSNDLRAARSKTKALDLLVEKLEAQHVLVAQSSKGYMPQQIPKRAKFSGMTVKDSKVPYIFIASGDEGEKMEPTGRKVFTLMLLTVLVARGRFAAVTYSGHTSEEVAPREYELTAQILMPKADFCSADLTTLDAVREIADVFKVTPSAVVMRARRLGMIDRDDADAYLEDLRLAYEQADHFFNPILPINALKRYNGLECSRRMLAILDSGGISRGDFCRVMFSNTLRTKAQISDYRAAVA